MNSKFTESADKVLNNALSLAEKLGHTYVGSEHLLLALAEDKDSRVAQLLASYGINNEKIKNAIIDECGCGNKTNLKATDTTPKLRKILKDAWEIAERNDSMIKAEHLFVALCEVKDGSMTSKILHKLGVDIKEFV
jgi:ATP-dependent Clp protease ATP-binding subunit ClpC